MTAHIFKHPRLQPAALAVLTLAFAGAPQARQAPAAPEFQIVESVPEASVYGEAGVPRAQPVWLQMIAGAKQSIDIAAFYISDKPGSPLAPVIDALAAKAKSGVKLRILVDQSFLKENADSVARLRQIDGITVRELPMEALTGGVLHAKYMVVDRHDVFVGSQNWDWRALSQIHEIGARVDNARFAQTFDAAFELDWQAAETPNLPKLTALAMAPLPFAPASAADPVILRGDNQELLSAFPAFSPPELTPYALTAEQPALVQMIQASRHDLRVQVMTLSAIRQYGPKGWWSDIDTALRQAAARGVKVQIIVADWALREPMQSYLKSLAVLPNIAVKFTQLPPSPQGFIPYARVEHAKYAVADERSIYIGTGNWEWSYFNNTVDASVFVQGEGPARTLTHIFDQDWNGPYAKPLEPGQHYEAPRNH
ncbi:MAG TPA: phospholipase D-like domain-containing protein [Dyella sp.]|uniref:phospholipase D-like domain-containing protein n=1 Tax=Dyella sp. TaxID=1869338 RepID=UPI002F9262E2